MRRCLTAILVVGLISVNSRDAAAQPSAKDIVAAAALSATPVGALTPIMVSTGMKGEKAFNSFSGRYSHYAPSGGGSGANVFGGSYYHKAGMNAAVSATAGYLTCDGCEGVLMLGGDVHSTLWDNSAAKSTTATSINLQGSLGWSKDDPANFLSLAVGVPLAISMEQASKSRIGFFVTPGYGWGRMSVTGASESGTRPFVGAGASWTAAAGWGLHLGYQRVIIEDAGNSIGGGFSWKM
jgi:hypothetical protein